MGDDNPRGSTQETKYRPRVFQGVAMEEIVSNLCIHTGSDKTRTENRVCSKLVYSEVPRRVLLLQ
jgi:hypothetical protein